MASGDHWDPEIRAAACTLIRSVGLDPNRVYDDGPLDIVRTTLRSHYTLAVRVIKEPVRFKGDEVVSTTRVVKVPNDVARAYLDAVDG